jgi:signal transduction histidine kinase
LDRQPVQLSQWLPAVVGPWREPAEEKGLAWETRIPLDLPGVLADPDRLAEVLNNLLANAIKYTSPPGNVTVDAGSGAESAWIRVSDTGPGIAPEEQDRIFEPFYRGTAASRFPQGMGLGLGIARDLVTAHGGQLTLERVSGLGSRFIIRLPCPRGPEDEAPT